MDKLLSNTQTGFLKGRSIMHGFHYAQEIIQAATRQKQNLTVFKADIHKAFDSIALPFFMKCLEAVGFKVQWRE
jgi:Reverse transcriptase (RNA-dependent DNA polymerase)